MIIVGRLGKVGEPSLLFAQQSIQVFVKADSLSQNLQHPLARSLAFMCALINPFDFIVETK